MKSKKIVGIVLLVNILFITGCSRVGELNNVITSYAEQEGLKDVSVKTSQNDDKLYSVDITCSNINSLNDYEKYYLCWYLCVFKEDEVTRVNLIGNNDTYTFNVEEEDVLKKDGEIYYLHETTSNNSNVSYSISSDISDDDKVLCWTIAKKEVEARLKSPSSAKFPFSANSDDVSITKNGDTYNVSAWVEAGNSFGAIVRSDFTVSLTMNGDKYSIISVDISLLI